jgi:hypothetical protein
MQVSAQAAEIAEGKIVPKQRSVAGKRGNGKDAQELACADKEV